MEAGSVPGSKNRKETQIYIKKGRVSKEEISEGKIKYLFFLLLIDLTDNRLFKIVITMYSVM